MGLGERWVRRVTYLACRGVSPLLNKPRDKLLVLRDVGCPRLAPELRHFRVSGRQDPNSLVASLSGGCPSP